MIKLSSTYFLGLTVFLVMVLVACAGSVPPAPGTSAQAVATIQAQQAKIGALQSALDAANISVGAGSTDVKSAKANLALANNNLIAAQSAVKQATAQVTAAQKNDAAKWRDIGLFLAALIGACGIAVAIFCKMEGWPLKWLGVMLGSISGGLILASLGYYAIVAYGCWIIVGLAALAIGILYYYLHTHASLLNSLPDTVKVAEADLTAMGKKAAAKYGVGIIADVEQVTKKI